ncbi:hypothetical protein IJD34_03360 [bacterium]|nr:hypothetical protein [bacterium]
MKTLAFLKAHEINPGLVDEYLKLRASDVDVIIVFDNKNNTFPKSENPICKINVYGIDIDFLLTDFDIYEKYNLPGFYDDKEGNDFNRFMWYNADYPLYLVKTILPNYDYYWQIEYDVYCNGTSYQPFFDIYNNNKNDLLIVRYTNALNDWWATEKTDWIWDESIQRHCCILPITRLSNSAIDYLYSKRLEHAEIYKNKINDENARWVFCELFLATEIANNKNLSAERIINQRITDSPVINLAKERLYLRQDNKLYHPVK